jgi:hypothetical protein
VERIETVMGETGGVHVEPPCPESRASLPPAQGP